MLKEELSGKDRVYIRSMPSKGIGIIVGSTRIKDEVTEVRVYFEKENVIASFKPNELVLVHDDDK